MAAAPTSLTLRMFNVGSGDCFLLTFNYAHRVRHMLVDFGSTAAPKRGPKKDYMLRVAEKIEEICAGKLHIVVATNRHRDHGDDNLKDESAVRNLLRMGRKGKAYFVNAGMKLKILPGVACTVLGPRPGTVRPLLPKVPSTEPPAGVRWFINQSRQIHADQMLDRVRDLDDVMNNTSVILLLEVGKQKILLPTLLWHLLKQNSRFTSSEEAEDSFCTEVTIHF